MGLQSWNNPHACLLGLLSDVIEQVYVGRSTVV